jgi:hypothetical protein
VIIWLKQDIQLTVNMTTNQSIIWFTAHKCASVYATEILHKLAQYLLMTHVNYEVDLWEAGQDFRKFFTENNFDVCTTTNHIYGPFRQYYSIPEMEEYKVIMMLRDPRDVLTSLYFSTAYSHYIPESQKTELESAREYAIMNTIDDFVIQHSPWVRETYNLYAKYFLKRKNVLFLKYEDMVTDFPTWLNEIFKHLQMTPSEQLIKELIEGAIFEVKEDIYSHKRQVKPGDHRRKLQVNTIKQLNLQLQDILEIYGWLTQKSQAEKELFELTLERAISKLDNFQFLLQQSQQGISA